MHMMKQDVIIILCQTVVDCFALCETWVVADYDNVVE